MAVPSPTARRAVEAADRRPDETQQRRADVDDARHCR